MGRTLAAMTRSASFPTEVKDVGSSSLLVSRGGALSAGLPAHLLPALVADMRRCSQGAGRPTGHLSAQGCCHAPAGASRRVRPEACPTSARALRLTMAVSGGALEVTPRVERTDRKDGQNISTVHGIVDERVIGHFYCIFCLTCGARAVEEARVPRRPRYMRLLLRRFLRRRLPMLAPRAWPHHHPGAGLA